MMSKLALCVVMLVLLGLAWPAAGADMQAYQKHIANFHKLTEKADQQRAKGNAKDAEKTMARAEDERALADLALAAPGRLPQINEPGPIVYYSRPYYGYWGVDYWRGPYRWWGCRGW